MLSFVNRSGGYLPLKHLSSELPNRFSENSKRAFQIF